MMTRVCVCLAFKPEVNLTRWHAGQPGLAKAQGGPASFKRRKFPLSRTLAHEEKPADALSGELVTHGLNNKAESEPLCLILGDLEPRTAQCLGIADRPHETSP
jgi:hypothetical protein